jgi:hypothetical protein
MGRTLIPNAKLPDRYHVCDETVRRWKADPGLRFPKPAALINNREYFDDDELQAWESASCSGGACLNADPTEACLNADPTEACLNADPTEACLNADPTEAARRRRPSS